VKADLAATVFHLVDPQQRSLIRIAEAHAFIHCDEKAGWNVVDVIERNELINVLPLVLKDVRPPQCVFTQGYFSTKQFNVHPGHVFGDDGIP
jgi:hypothetical protein